MITWKKWQVKLGIVLFAFLFVLSACSDEKEVIPPAVDPTPETPVDPDEPGGEEEDDEIIPAHNTVLGSLCGFEGSLRRGEAYKGDDKPTTYYNVPLFEAVPAGTENGWWDNLVEEIAYSGLDFIMMNCRGQQPSYPAKNVDHGDPTLLNRLVDAMRHRGVDDKFKIALFDDCPATWEAARNEDLDRGYAAYDASNPQGRLPYPLKDIDIHSQAFQDSIFQYIWDYNLRLAFQNVPKDFLYMDEDGRPLIFFWGCSFVGAEGSVNGKLVYILEQVREKCMQEFGMDPVLVIDQDWLKRDHELATSGVVDGVNDWFNMEVPYTVRTFNDMTIGIGVPGFLVNDLSGGKMFLDARQGKLMKEALRYCIGQRKSDLVLLEGFTDVLENAAYWRSPDKTYYKFPNQRLNILRKWSSDPYPTEFKVEAEACDYYYDRTKGNSGGQYRNDFEEDKLDVTNCDDEYWGWCVTHALTDEWLRWVELPFRAGQSTIKLRYSTREDAQIRFDVAGKEGTVIDLPSTNGRWAEIDAATVSFDQNGWHEVILNVVSGNANLMLNCFTIVASE